jgi:hypoxanthine phosphoribosyltransferase
MIDIFQKIEFTSHAGLDLKWKIEMDALSHREWECITQMIMEISPPFREAIGIPRGGNVLGKLLNRHGTGKEEDPICIVDDVLTTGMSMNTYREEMDIERWQKSCALGWVVFARVRPPKWIKALFQMPVI